jgi:hypothetical protein
LFFSKAELDEWVFKNRNQKSSPQSGIPSGEDRGKNDESEDDEEPP